MKRSPMPPRTEPLKAGKALGRRRKPRKGRKPGKGTRKALRPVNSARAAKAWVRAFHSKEFKKFTRDSRCVRCGRTGCDPHHEPLRSQGGTWKNVSPVCPDCHTLAGDSRHNTSAERFWTFGITSERSNANHHARWLAHVDAGSVPGGPVGTTEAVRGGGV